MIYRNFKDKELSLLGMGTMRLPVIDGNDSVIDQEQTEKMTEYAMEHGVNYYDTAWGYHGGNSEIAMGKALAKYPRENFYLATKFPGYDLNNMGKHEEIFEKQLEKLQMDYVDFYLVHNVCELNIDAYLAPDLGLLEYLREQKANGRIKHLGLSCHGSIDVMNRFLEVYGDDMEFCQIQLNYLDWDFQDAKLKVERCNELGLPVWVMEPLRGGRLCNLKEEEAAVLKEMRPEESLPGFAFRYLQSIPGVTVVLGGMSDFQQMQENIATFETEEPLTGEELIKVYALAKKMTSGNTVPCTACHYCTSHCPMELDIPELLGLYNENSFTDNGFIAPMALAALPEEKKPAACIGCRSCEAVCPQQIKISEALADFSNQLN